MQPTHKACNQQRGTTPLTEIKKKQHKPVDETNIHINIVFDAEEDQETPVKVYRSRHFGLRKQDAWCHKQCCCRYR
jgi:hypothetical protein